MGRAQKSPGFLRSWDWAQKTRTALLKQQLKVPQGPLLDSPSLVCSEGQDRSRFCTHLGLTGTQMLFLVSGEEIKAD